jgi:hypothetical protein
MPVLPPSKDEFKYWSFISYSHKDKKWGDWLHRKLETFRVPQQLQVTDADEQTIPSRLFPIFRDREELPTSANLGNSIQSALSQSRSMIVICSPDAAKSRWVNEEILSFKRMGRAGRIFCLIVDGEPNASDDSKNASRECFPEAIRYEMNADGSLTDVRTEPIAADARDGLDGRQDAFLKLVAGVLGIGFDDLKRRDHQRQVRRLTFIGVAAGLMAVAMSGLSLIAWQSSREAESQRKIADANFRRAKSAVDRFFTQVSEEELFKVHGLQPLQQKLLEESLSYYEEFQKQRSDDPSMEADVAGALMRIGQIRTLIGDRDIAMSALEKAESKLDALLLSDPDNFDLRLQRADLHSTKAETYWDAESPMKALRELVTAEAQLNRLVKEHPEDVSTLVAWQNSLLNLGPYQRRSGKVDDARETYLRAIDGESLRVAGDDLRSLLFRAQAALNLGVILLEVDRDLESALTRFQQCDTITANALENGNAEQSNDFAVAKRTFEELLVNAKTYYAVALKGLGRTEEAAKQNELGLEIARYLYRRNPAVVGYQESVAILASNLAAGHDNLGYEGTLLLHEEAVEMARRLAINDPESRNFRFRLAGALNNMAIRQADSGEIRAARQSYQEAITTIESLIGQSGDQPEPNLTLQLINSRRNLGSAFMTGKEFAKADESYAVAEREMNEFLLRSEVAWNSELLSIQDAILEKRIQIASATGNTSAAKKAQASLSHRLQERLGFAGESTDRSVQERLALHRLQYRLASSLTEEEKNDDAKVAYLRVVESVSAIPLNSVTSMEKTLKAYAHANLGWFSILDRDFSEAVKQSRTALEMQDEDWIRTNLISALLLENQLSGAMSIFQAIPSSKAKLAFLKGMEKEFEQLLKIGIKMPLADEFLSSSATDANESLDDSKE